MNYDFAPFTLSSDRAELVGPLGVVDLEPKAFAVLRLLVENHSRVVSREEMIEVVWGGRFISDAAVATALKLARRALGDDGAAQTYIKTLHGVGHRFVAPVQRRAMASAAAPLVPEVADPIGQRPTIAVLPFWQNPDDRVQTGDGLADEIVSALSRLRWLRVIASESTFRFRQDSVDMAGLRSVLGAGYVLKGRVDLAGSRLRVLVTLIETKGGSVVWSDHFTSALDDIHQSRHDIVAAVIGALDLQISQVEVAAARGRPVEALDAWGAYHLGMSHFYRFNAHDNAIALGLFERATTLDPGFATAFAAGSFAKHQEVTQAYGRDHASIIHEARRLAERAVTLDPFDPLANMMMGRVSLLTDGPDDGMVWYDRSTHLSPSFSKGHYSRGIVDMLAGRTVQARAGLDTALGLSPMDPLLGIMLTAKALTYVVEGEYSVARDWALRSVRVNQAHFLVVTTAILSCQLAGDEAEAAHWVQHLRSHRPEASVTPYLKTLHFADDALRARVRSVLVGLGIPE